MGRFADDIRLDAQKKGFTFDLGVDAWLDRLLRPQYASVAVARRLMEDRPEDIPGGIWRGLTGKEKGSYQDIAKEMDLPAPFWWGLAGDIAFDPLTYIPIGKVGKVFSPLKKIPGVSKAGAAIYKTKAVQTFGKAFIPNFRPWEISPEKWKMLVEARNLAKGIKAFGTEQAIRFSKEVEDDIAKFIKKDLIDIEDLPALIESVERRAFGFGLPPEVQGTYEKLVKYWQDLRTRRGATGKRLLTDEEISHFFRKLSKEAEEALKKGDFDVMMRRMFTTHTGEDYARQYLKFTTLGGQSRLFIGKANKLKVVPYRVQGWSADELADFYVSTIEDFKDLERILEAYGIKQVRRRIYLFPDGASAKYTPATRTISYATKGHSQAEILKSIAHELGHGLAVDLRVVGEDADEVHVIAGPDLAAHGGERVYRDRHGALALRRAHGQARVLDGDGELGGQDLLAGVDVGDGALADGQALGVQGLGLDVLLGDGGELDHRLVDDGPGGDLGGGDEDEALLLLLDVPLLEAGDVGARADDRKDRQQDPQDDADLLLIHAPASG